MTDIAYQIYMKLLESGASSARTISINLGIPRPSVYGHLKILVQIGLVDECDKDNIKVFQVGNSEKLPQIISEKIKKLEGNLTMAQTLLPTLIKKTKSVEPKIKSYSGPEGIKEILKDLLWNNDIETLTMWPISEMIHLLGKDYLEDLNRKRIRRKISIRGIWPHNKKVNLKSYPFLGIGPKHLRELRIAPKEMDWNMSYWLYGDKVAFISSHEETFGFVVTSRDFVSLMKSQFELIWKMSKPIKAKTVNTDKFLDSL